LAAVENDRESDASHYLHFIAESLLTLGRVFGFLGLRFPGREIAMRIDLNVATKKHVRSSRAKSSKSKKVRRFADLKKSSWYETAAKAVSAARKSG
jgi:hypothetical protein